jgi:hypothetical protein
VPEKRREGGNTRVEACGDEGEADGDEDEPAEEGLVVDVDVGEEGRAPDTC